MSEVELSRLLHEQLPKFIHVLDLLGLEVVDANYVQAMKTVLKETL